MRLPRLEIDDAAVCDWWEKKVQPYLRGGRLTVTAALRLAKTLEGDELLEAFSYACDRADMPKAARTRFAKALFTRLPKQIRAKMANTLCPPSEDWCLTCTCCRRWLKEARK